MPNAFSYDSTLYPLRLLLRHSSFFPLLRHRHRFSMWATQILLTTHTQTHTHTQVLSQSHKLMCCLIHRRRKHTRTRTRRKNHRFFEIWSLFLSLLFVFPICAKKTFLGRSQQQAKNMIRSSSWNYFNNLLWTNLHRMKIHCELCMHIYLDNEDRPKGCSQSTVAWA